MSFRTTQEQLSEAFSSVGQVVSVFIGTDRATGRSRGFAFVEFSSDDEASRAVETFNEKEVDGRKLRVSPAEDRPPRRAPGAGFASRDDGPRDSFGGGGGFGGGRPFNKPKGSRRGLRGRKRSLN